MATLNYQHTEPLTDSAAVHVEAARQRVHAACLLQAYPQWKTAGVYTVTVGEILTLPAGKKLGSITRTLIVTI